MHNNSLLDAKEELLKLSIITYFAKLAILGPELFQIVTSILIAGSCISMRATYSFDLYLPASPDFENVFKSQFEEYSYT